MERKFRIVIASPLTQAVIERACRQFDARLSQERSLSAVEAVEAAIRHEADGLLVSTRQKWDGIAIAALPSHVKVMATCSVGYDHIDLETARGRGLPVTNTPDVLTDATADLTFLLILGAARRARDYVKIMESGWRTKFGLDEMLGMQVGGKTLGIMGMGRIGRAVAQRAIGFGMRVLYSDVARLPSELEQGRTYFSDFRDMLPHCDFLSLHLPGGPASNRIMNGQSFALMPKGGILVNAARGSLVDESALIDALRSGHLAAAGLDVYSSEPDYDLRLRDMPNIFMTPHMGSATIETRNAMGFRALDNIAAVLDGRAPLDPV